MKDSQSHKKETKQLKKNSNKKRKFIKKAPSARVGKSLHTQSVIKKLFASLLFTGSKSKTISSKRNRPVKKESLPRQKSAGENKFSAFFKKYEKDIQLILIPLIFLIVLFTITLINNGIVAEIGKNKINPSEAFTEVNPYPFVQNISAPTLSAKAAIITDADSQVILFSKNPNVRLSMASTTKIMTALTALDYYKDDSILTVKSAGVQGSTIGLRYGEKLFFKDLLFAMLLPSANDAAVSIADNFPGGVESFVLKMNEKAQTLHLYNTHFSDPTGLDDDGNYTTVVDMAHLASFAIKNSEFTEITSTKQRIITTVDSSKRYALFNLNKLLGKDGVTGIKTGTTEAAGEVLVTSTVENGHTFIIVVMNSQNRFVDTKNLLSFISQSVRYVTPAALPLKED